MVIDNRLLKKINLLYVEDDKIIRDELSSILSNFFNNVYTAEDGQEGFKCFLKEKIDIVLSDINMPKFNGIQMVKAIREKNENIPVVFTTAHTDTEFLLDAIKLKIDEYITKPLDIKKLVYSLNAISLKLDKDRLLEQKREEIDNYKDIIDLNNIVIKTDTKMKITYVNNLFCQTSGFSKNELISKDLKLIRHKNIAEEVFTKIYAEVLNNGSWKGKLKFAKKDLTTDYDTEAFVSSLYDDSGDITEIILVLRDITEELNQKRDLQKAMMKEKSEIFKKSQEDSAEQNQQIANLKKEYVKVQKELQESLVNLDKYIYSNEKYKIENKNLNTELSLYKKNTNTNTSFKLAKENSDLRLLIKKAKEEFENLKMKAEKDLAQAKVNSQIKIDELENKITNMQETIDSIQSDEVLLEKLEYWKEKAKSEAKRVEELEKQIIEYGDSSFMNRIFG